MVTYWRSGHWLGAVKCPICRQTVCLTNLYILAQLSFEQSQDVNDTVGGGVVTVIVVL